MPHELWYTGHEDYWNNLITKPIRERIEDRPNLPQTDLPDSNILPLAKSGASIRDIAKTLLNLSIG